MTSEFDGRVALVTGGGSGIGRAACIAFAKAGAAVAIVDRYMAAAEETAAMIGASSARVIPIDADVSLESDVDRMVDVTVAELGGLHLAFNNAGIGGAEVNSGGKRLGEIGRPAWDKIMAINLTGVWLCMKAEIAAMQKNKGGAIVNTASMAGLIGLAGSGPYSASKHAVIGLTKSAALEYAVDGIRVNAICPGFVETPLTKDVLSRNSDKIMVRLPMKRLAQPEEIADVALWLCSERSSYVTGVAYAVDGGYTTG